MQDGSTPGKETVNLPIDAELLKRAQMQSLDLADLLELALLRELDGKTARPRSTAAGEWRRDNAEAIAAWNKEVERDGLWNDEFRPF